MTEQKKAPDVMRGCDPLMRITKNGKTGWFGYTQNFWWLGQVDNIKIGPFPTPGRTLRELRRAMTS